METMANRIEQALNKKNGGNQSELARFVGVTPQAVQKWIAGEAEPRGKNLLKVAEFVGVPPAVLRFGEGDPMSDQRETQEEQRRPEPRLEVAPPQDNNPDFVNSEEILQLIDLFSQSSAKGRRFILESARVAEKFSRRRAGTGTSD